MNDREETLLGLRPLVLWAWLMGCLLWPALDPDPVAAYLCVACLLFAAARWSATVRREASVALLVLDAPAIFLLQRQQGWPPLLVLAVLSALLVAMWAMRRRKHEAKRKTALLGQAELP